MAFCCGCGEPAPKSVEDIPDIPKSAPALSVLVVGVQGLPANRVPIEDRSIYFTVSVPELGMDLAPDVSVVNVIDPIFNHEFEVQAANLEFKVMEQVGDLNPVLLGTAALDASYCDSWVRDIPLRGDLCKGAIITVKVKAEGYQYPEDAALTDYIVSVDNPKKSKNLGLELDNTDSACCYVTRVKPNGVVDNHNLQAAESDKLQDGAYIVAYNGVGDKASSIQSQMKKAATTAEFTIRPMEKFRIAIDKSSSSVLGIDVPRKPVGNSVLIASVKEDGYVAKWNEEHPEQEVMKCDRIVEVNGRKGTAKDLIDMVKKAPTTQRVVLTISRMKQPVQ